MEITSKTAPKSKRDIFYFRQRFKNRVFSELVSFFVREAERIGLTKRDLAFALGKDPAVVTRIFREPGNLTLETISDILLAMDAEPEPPKIVRFSERPRLNDMHPLMAKALGQLPPPPTPKPTEFHYEAKPSANAGIKVFDQAGAT